MPKPKTKPEPTSEPTSALTLRLPTALLETLREMSVKRDRSLNAQVIRVLREWTETADEN